MNIARQLAIASEVRKVPSYYAERVAQRIERGSATLPARYIFADGSIGQFASALDERSRVVVRFEEVTL
jgi:hypothetical protein